MLQTGPPAQNERSLGELLKDLTQEIVTLFRQEFTLAKAEMSQKAVSIGKNVGLLAAGALIGYAGALAIIAALVLLLSQAGLPFWASALIVGGVVVVIGGVLVMKGLTALRNEDLVPRQTLQTLQEIKNG